jgi:hypothetical protein
MKPDYEALAGLWVNNWEDFGPFMLFDRSEYEGFYVLLCSDDHIDAAAIDAGMLRYVNNYNLTVRLFSAVHWGKGLVYGYAVKVYTATGNTTDAFEALCDCIREVGK